MRATGRSTTRTRPSSSRRARTGSRSRSPSRWTRDPGTKWSLQQRRQPVAVRHHPHGHRPVHRRLRDRHAVPAARHPRLPLEEDADRTSGHGGRAVPLAEDLAKIGYCSIFTTAVWKASASCRRIGSERDDAPRDRLARRWDYGYQWWMTSRGRHRRLGRPRLRRTVPDRHPRPRHRRRHPLMERLRRQGAADLRTIPVGADD